MGYPPQRIPILHLDPRCSYQRLWPWPHSLHTRPHHLLQAMWCHQVALATSTRLAEDGPPLAHAVTSAASSAAAPPNSTATSLAAPPSPSDAFEAKPPRLLISSFPPTWRFQPLHPRHRAASSSSAVPSCLAAPSPSQQPALLPRRLPPPLPLRSLVLFFGLGVQPRCTGLAAAFTFI